MLTPLAPVLRSLYTGEQCCIAAFEVCSFESQSTSPEEVTLEKVNLIITLQNGTQSLFRNGFEEIVAITGFSLGIYLKDGSSF